ncbi:polyprenyl synthetase family protein [Streptomyces atratus]|uniref:Polyprenyl diphosphate synthase n=1 Tax=Streptomyces atratus TaxID=1893 RepID=A0A2Z5JHX2_STRAR|nr:polyprenyl synthetase family protein [Streptomyces atratus]AXE79832.1 polyprenyl diphosphate synthase [Streptomyces atratus]QBG38792.1 Atr31 [Streptomyces atratus]
MNVLSAPERRSLVSGLAADDPALRDRLTERLRSTEQRLQERTARGVDPRVAGLVGHLVATGGKRLRPLLVLLGAEFGDPGSEDVIEAAVLAELIHVSSLYHDDVIDDAGTRHGAPSANALWGKRRAVFAGDWLLALAAQVACELGPQAVRMNAVAADRLVHGQTQELLGPGPGTAPLDHYFQVAAGKSASLIALSLQLGAVQAGAPDAYVTVLAEYGEQLGLAFQISDDLLDISSPLSASGKEPGMDLEAGVPSLPVLLALAGDDLGDGELRDLIATGPAAGTRQHRRALELLQDSAALAAAGSMMYDRLALARTALTALPQTPALRVLDALCDFVAHRTG